MIDRRTFLAGTGAVLLAAPLAAEAQPTKKVWRIGFLSAGTPQSSPSRVHFRQGLKALGYVEGRDFVMEERFAEGHQDRLPELAADLVRSHVDVIVTVGTPATLAATQATGTIPIVSPVAASLVEKGIVKSLARPGGNVTGLTTQVGTLKLYQLLKEAVPKVSRVVYLYDPASTVGGAERVTSQAQAANVELQLVALRDPTDIAQAFAEFRRGTNGLVLDRATILQLREDQICKLALQRKLPTAALGRSFAETAKALGLTIPQSLLLRADEVIQ